MSTSTATTLDTQNVEKETSGMLDAAARNYTKPLWLEMARLNPPLPNPRCIPHVWEYENIRPSLIKAGKLVPEEKAERRVLMLVNPNREPPFSTDTLYAGLQLVMPNETAKAHRHVAFAMRFIIEGHGGFTAVQGKRITMKRGDVILTPSWNWHDHGKDGSGPMIWLDGLDLPNYTYYPVHFVEHYQQARYPAQDVDSNKSPIVFPWSEMRGRLDATPGTCASLRYLRNDGAEVSKILGGCAERIDAGTSSIRVQETASAVYHVVEGSGHSIIDGKKYSWTRGDTFAVPSWQAYQHFADKGTETTYLYRFDDQPMLKSLGFYRTSEMDVESLVSV